MRRSETASHLLVDRVQSPVDQVVQMDGRRIGLLADGFVVGTQSPDTGQDNPIAVAVAGFIQEYGAAQSLQFDRDIRSQLIPMQPENRCERQAQAHEGPSLHAPQFPVGRRYRSVDIARGRLLHSSLTFRLACPHHTSPEAR